MQHLALDHHLYADGKEGPTLPDIQSVERAIAILKSFTSDTWELSVMELSRTLGLHKSTVSRLLGTLENGGLVERNPETGRYQLGMALIRLGALVAAHADLREVAHPILKRLSEEVHETVSMGILHKDMVLTVLDLVPSVRTVKGSANVGNLTPPHCTATGKVLLAYRPEAEIERYSARGLRRLTAKTIADPHCLREELTRIRFQGFATAFEELEVGLHAVAAPVSDHTGQVIAAMAVYGPSYRLPPERIAELADVTISTANQISQKLGYPGQ